MTTNPVALITGAGSGIGRALAHRLSRDGYAIAALDMVEAGIAALADELRAKGVRIATAIADVTEPAALVTAVKALENALGPIDLVIASAGIGAETSALDYRTEVMNKVLSVNLLGVSNTFGAVLPGMIERRRGHLVGISSMASCRGFPRMLAYSASKAGVNAILDGMRVELQPYGIYATTVCPGWIRTPMTAQVKGVLDYLMEPEVAADEIAYAIKHKLSYYAFPRMMRWRMRFLTWLPRSWQDAWIRKMMKAVKIDKGIKS